jgi:hypothetical protein
MKRVLDGGPMDGEEMEMPDDPPMPWIKLIHPDHLPQPVFTKEPVTISPVPVALYRLVRYTDGRLGYKFVVME